MAKESDESELDELEQDLERIVKMHQRHLDNFREKRRQKRTAAANGGESKQKEESVEPQP